MEEHMYRSKVPPGTEVLIVLKKDQQTGILTHGFVQRILTNSRTHPRGIKVMLQDGQVGRVQKIIKQEIESEEDVYGFKDV